MESMSNAPHMIEKFRTGCKMGHQTVKDSMVSDGLWDCYNDCHMGSLAELCAEKRTVSREQQDQFAITSFNRANENVKAMAAEIVPVAVPQRRGDPVMVTEDEPPTKGRLDKLPTLR